MTQIDDWLSRTNQPQDFLGYFQIDVDQIPESMNNYSGGQGQIQNTQEIDKIYKDYSNPNILFLEQVDYRKSYTLDFSTTFQQRRQQREAPKNSKQFVTCKSCWKMRNPQSINLIFAFYCNTLQADQFINIMRA